MQSLFARIKRQAVSVQTGDLQDFKQNGQLYIKFIDDLTKLFSEPNENYGSIKVTKRKDGITKVNLKNGDTQVNFIYRNRDLYIIGFVTGSVFYVDGEVYEGLGRRIPRDWASVIGTNNAVSLVAFSYSNIMSAGSRATLNMSNLDRSLEQLTLVGDNMRRIDILSEHLAPFVVAFSEAIRFPVVAKSVQEAIVKDRERGVLRLDKNVVPARSLGHPDQRKDPYVLDIYSLLLNWGKLSERVEPLYKNQHGKCIEDTNYVLNLCKGQLNALLGMANSQAFKKFVPVPARSKRDLDYTYSNAFPQHLPLLEQEDIINRIDYEGPVRQSSSAGITNPTIRPDLVGGLHLLTVGMLYLYGRKMNTSIGSYQSYHDPLEANGIAVDLVDRIVCFLKSAGFEMEIGFDEAMKLQRELSEALIRGENLAQVLTSFLERNYLAEMDGGILDKFREQLSTQLGNESGMLSPGDLDGKACFQ